MKNLFAALVAVFFMFTTIGCGDDTETETTPDVVEAVETDDAGASEDSAEEVVEDSATGEGEGEGESADAETDEASDASAEEGDE